MLNNMTLLPAVSSPKAAAGWAAEPYAGLSAIQHMSAPISAAQGTAVSFAGRVSVMTDGLDVTATPGSPPREAPV